MLRDRGSKKWTAMMLPEHLRLLREWQDEDAIPDRKEPDEQQLEEWEFLLSEAMEWNKEVAIRYWKNGNPQEVKGYVHCSHNMTGTLRIVTQDGEAKVVPVRDIERISGME
ncbi:YolD-like family protein [Chungangia koreensis]|uniref:YolD-like family protein n=1 Tax=Chungangia koreensis TaxID=752657 RepID=A0ABV8X721_9LACT